MGVRLLRSGRVHPSHRLEAVGVCWSVWRVCSWHGGDALLLMCWQRLPARIIGERRKERKGNKKRFGRIIARTLIIKYDVLLFVVVALLQSLDDGAKLLHSVGCVDLAAYTHDTHQATTATA